MQRSTELRTQYLASLTYKKVWLRPQDQPVTHQTCIIFDWDDTILCTSVLSPYHYLLKDSRRKIPKEIKQHLALLYEHAQLMLQKAKSFGKTYIVTNAAEGWVELSA